jgi:NADH-quinone oxidoreductase subunit H
MINDIVVKAHDLLLAAVQFFGGNQSLGEVLFLVAFAFAMFQVFAGFAILGGWLERKLIARVHSRVGPIYNGPFGLLQTVADAVKFLKKEVIFPVGSDRKLFVLAPLLMFLTSFVSVIFLPLASFTLISSPYSLLIILALLSLTPIAILTGAWASNSKYSTLGGLRSAGMTMAYEVLLAVAVASIILTTHSFSIIEIVAYQQTHGMWMVFIQPVAFVLFMIAAVASVERNPMDLTEAESELVGGWKTEYGAVYFSLTLLGEYVKLLIMTILISCLFLGGWTDFAGEFGFVIKILLLTMFMIYIRATAMRLRIDQLLHQLWTKLIPLAFLNFLITIGVLKMLGGA